MMSFRKDFTLFNCILTCFLLNELACCSEAQVTISTPPENTTVCKGSDVTISCGYTSATVLPVTWIINDTSFTQEEIVNSPLYQLNNPTSPMTTSLTVFSFNGNTTFQCIVLSTPTTTSTRGTVTVTNGDLSAVTATVNIVKNVAIVAQWDAVDGAITYRITWTNGTGPTYSRHTSRTSFTGNVLNFDIVYTITLSVLYSSGYGPRFTTSVSLYTDTTSTACIISPTVTVSTTPMTIVSTANPSSTTTIALISSSTTTTTIMTTTATSTVVVTTNPAGTTTADETNLSAVTVNAMKNIAIVAQWDAVDGAINYAIRWTNESNITQALGTTRTSITINGLTHDTVYTIFALNRCGLGPYFITSVHLSLSTACTISPTVTVSTTPMTILSTANPSTTTIAFISSSTTTTTITTTTVTSKSTVVESSVIIPSAITYPSTTNIVDSPISTTKPANTPTVDETNDVPTSNDSDSSSDSGAIIDGVVGGVVGGVILLLIITVVLCIVMIWYHRKGTATKENSCAYTNHECVDIPLNNTGEPDKCLDTALNNTGEPDQSLDIGFNNTGEPDGEGEAS